LEIEQLRLGRPVAVKWDIVTPDPSHAKVPQMILQPLVENSIQHGMPVKSTGRTFNHPRTLPKMESCNCRFATNGPAFAPGRKH